VLHAWAAGKEEAVEFLCRYRVEGRIRVHGHPAAASDVDAGTEGSHNDLHARPAEEVERGDKFNFLKPFGEDCEYRGHGVM
jgi:hypothetical protein